MIKALSAVTVAALAMVGAAQAATVTKVDLFSVNQALVTDNTVNGFVVASQVGSAANNSISNPLGTILGGFRELIVDLKDNGGNSNRKAEMGVGGGQLDFSTSSLASGTGIVRWDGATQTTPGNDTGVAGAIDTSGLGGAFLGNVLTDSFEIQTVFSDGGFKFKIEAYTQGGASSSVVEITSLQHLVPTTSYIPLLAFLDCGFSGGGITVTCTGGGVDFANLGALQVVIDPDGTFTSLDLTLNQVTVVPEPNAIALVGLALIGAGVASRRRKV